MTKRQWESDKDEHWQKMIARDAERAEKDQKPPSAQCCFGIANESLGGRCQKPSLYAGTFYGFTIGFALCENHSRWDTKNDYPHGRIKISVKKIESQPEKKGGDK